eukprot:7193544-Alexandrium_andersonii.AAC.1
MRGKHPAKRPGAAQGQRPPCQRTATGRRRASPAPCTRRPLGRARGQNLQPRLGGRPRWGPPW